MPTDTIDGKMIFWPFRSKSKRNPKILASGAIDETMHNYGISRDHGRHNESEISPSGPERRKSRRDSQKKRKSSRESKKLQKSERRRTYSFSPGRNDTLRVSANRPPVPPLPNSNLKGTGTRPDNALSEGTSTQPVDTEDWQRMPTLHKRSAQDVARRKSSKKRKEEHNREAEIKAMVEFMPTRPATDFATFGRPMKRDSRNKHGRPTRETHSSDISLPSVESMRSCVSSNSEHQTSYKLSALDMLAPRPTIRYSAKPQYLPGASGFGAERSNSRRKRVSDRVLIPEETLRSNKRIDELADDLDAAELRELMERDQKRRQKKKMAEEIKLQKKLARRQEKQRAEEAAATRDGSLPPTNMERGVFGREVIGLGIGTSAVATSSKRKSSDDWDTGRGKRSADSFHAEHGASNIETHVQRTTSLATPGSELSGLEIETAQIGTMSKGSPPSQPKQTRAQASSISEVMDTPSPHTTSARHPSPSRLAQSWTSFFRRSIKPRRQVTPSFSNTSRDSMQNGQTPQIGYSPIRRQTSNIPKRTMSRFREDLPELPMSPPDSRVQSPEVDAVPPIRSDFIDKKSAIQASIEDSLVARYDTPTSGYRSLEATRLRDETPTSGHRSIDAPSPEPTTILSQSLASIDSEGSWLSGRKGNSKRGSTQPYPPLRDSASSLQRRYQEYSESVEELGIAEDEFFSRLTPGPEEDHHKIKKTSTENTMASSDEDDGDSPTSPIPSEKTKWGAVARHPTIVHREPQRAASRHGFLNDEMDYDSSGSIPSEALSLNQTSYEQPIADEPGMGVHRATSVDLGKNHGRHLSAGSVRLLDMKLKTSQDSKRLSSD